MDVKAAANDLLREQWVRLQTISADKEAMAGAVGYLFAIWQVGGINYLEHEAWRERFTRCPDGGPQADHGPLAWCNYCGDVPRESGTEAGRVAE